LIIFFYRCIEDVKPENKIEKVEKAQNEAVQNERGVYVAWPKKV
jgi:hypothetical protein